MENDITLKSKTFLMIFNSLFNKREGESCKKWYNHYSGVRILLFQYVFIITLPQNNE